MTIKNILLPQQGIVFESTKNTRLNRMRYHILFLPCREN